MSESEPLRVILHAPTANALQRARNNASNLRRVEPQVQVRIIANADAVVAALDAEPHEQDGVTYLCAVTLDRANRVCREPLQPTDGPSVLVIARLQQQGWCYIRA